MKAMIIGKLGSVRENPAPLEPVEVPVPSPGAGEILVKVSTCGVCRTELDEIEGRTPPPRFPVIPGHQVVGRVVESGPGCTRYPEGTRVGIGWIFSACRTCRFCRAGLENLCPEFRATGRDENGGYAEYMRVPEDFAYPIPEGLTDSQAAPLLCGGAIGYRSLKLTGLCDGQKLGLTGFGSSAHLVLKMAKHMFPGSEVFVFARSQRQREFAMALGAVWAGDTCDSPPAKLDSIIDTTPAWKPVAEALKHLEPGGRLVINAIGKEERDKKSLLSIDYAGQLWMEKEIKSVANVCREDVAQFLEMAGRMGIKPEYSEYELGDANRAIHELATSRIRGAKVLRIV